MYNILFSFKAFRLSILNQVKLTILSQIKAELQLVKLIQLFAELNVGIFFILL